MLFDQKSPVHMVLGLGRWHNSATDIATYRPNRPRGWFSTTTKQFNNKTRSLGNIQNLKLFRINKVFGQNISSCVSSDFQEIKCAADNVDKTLFSASWLDDLNGPKSPSDYFEIAWLVEGKYRVEDWKQLGFAEQWRVCYQQGYPIWF